MDDRELLELAAKAAGLPVDIGAEGGIGWFVCGFDAEGDPVWWNPLKDDGDALRLAVKLNLDVRYESYDAGVAVIVGAAWDEAPEAVHEIFERDGPRATRRAIVRAAAEIGAKIGEK